MVRSAVREICVRQEESTPMTTIFSLTTLQTAALGLSLAALVQIESAAAANPFSTLQGSWGGSGRVQFEGGQSEALRCSAHYTGGGNQLGLAIRCASASNRIEIRGRLVNSGGRVSGTWEERTFNVSVTASGRASDSNIVLRLAGSIPGTMSVSVAPGRQTVSISTSSNVRSVRIGLRRR